MPDYFYKLYTDQLVDETGQPFYYYSRGESDAEHLEEDKAAHRQALLDRLVRDAEKFIVEVEL